MKTLFALSLVVLAACSGKIESSPEDASKPSQESINCVMTQTTGGSAVYNDWLSYGNVNDTRLDLDQWVAYVYSTRTATDAGTYTIALNVQTSVALSGSTVALFDSCK